MSVEALAVIMVFAIPLVAVIGGLVLAALKILKSGSGKSQKDAAEEGKMMQDIYHGLLKMEERVESLETVLLDRERKGVAQ